MLALALTKMHPSVILFSPHYLGSDELWHWLAERSNGRAAIAPPMSAAQHAYALAQGYLAAPPLDIPPLSDVSYR